MTALIVFRIKEVEMNFEIYTEPKLQDPWVCTIITMRVRPSVWQLLKMIITLEPYMVYIHQFCIHMHVNIILHRHVYISFLVDEGLLSIISVVN